MDAAPIFDLTALPPACFLNSPRAVGAMAPLTYTTAMAPSVYTTTIPQAPHIPSPSVSPRQETGSSSQQSPANPTPSGPKKRGRKRLNPAETQKEKRKREAQERRDARAKKRQVVHTAPASRGPELPLHHSQPRPVLQYLPPQQQQHSLGFPVQCPPTGAPGINPAGAVALGRPHHHHHHHHRICPHTSAFFILDTESQPGQFQPAAPSADQLRQPLSDVSGNAQLVEDVYLPKVESWETPQAAPLQVQEQPLQLQQDQDLSAPSVWDARDVWQAQPLYDVPEVAPEFWNWLMDVPEVDSTGEFSMLND